MLWSKCFSILINLHWNRLWPLYFWGCYNRAQHGGCSHHGNPENCPITEGLHSAAPISPCPCFSKEPDTFRTWSSTWSQSPSSSGTWSLLHSIQQQPLGTLAAALLCCRELLKNEVKPGKEYFQFLQYTATFSGPALALYGEYWRGLMTWAEVLVTFFTSLPSTTIPLPCYEEQGSDHGLSPGGNYFRLLWGTWCWGSCHLLPLLPQPCHSCCSGWGSWQMPARQPEVIMPHYTYNPEFTC